MLIFLMLCSIFLFGILFDQFVNKTVCPDQNRDNHRSINRGHEHVQEKSNKLWYNERKRKEHIYMFGERRNF